MPWRRFLVWNALGGICWAITIGAAGYLIGQSVSGSLGAAGFVLLAVLALGYLVFRLRLRRMLDEPDGDEEHHS
jgi:membrane protein DedA with SNARE-associated domain